MSNGDVVRIIMELLAKTKRGEVAWAEPSGIDMLTVLYPDNLILTLPRSRITVRRGRNKESIEFQIQNDGGAVIQHVTAKHTDGLYAPLSQLLESGLNQARRVDQTMRDVEDFLKKPPQKP